MAQQQQQRSHVPRFGSWDKDNIPYTAYFENARKERAGERMMNPNDPQENPDAFGYKAGGSMEVDNDFSMKKSPVHPTVFSTNNARVSGNRKSITNESPSHKTNSDHSLLQAALQRFKHERRKSDTTVSFSPASGSRHFRDKTADHLPDDNYDRAASVPKFGSWDETDPKSGEGFTIVFNRVKEEKQIASTTLAPVPSYTHTQVNRPSSSSRASRLCSCCCWFWHVNE